MENAYTNMTISVDIKILVVTKSYKIGPFLTVSLLHRTVVIYWCSGKYVVEAVLCEDKIIIEKHKMYCHCAIIFELFYIGHVFYNIFQTKYKVISPRSQNCSLRWTPQMVCRFAYGEENSCTQSSYIHNVIVIVVNIVWLQFIIRCFIAIIMVSYLCVFTIKTSGWRGKDIWVHNGDPWWWCLG